MRNIILIVLALIIIALIITVARAMLANPQKQASVTIQNQKFLVNVARSTQEKQTGLSGKNSIKDNEGMLFVYDTSGKYTFWMKDMKFPIDILYIENGKVVEIFKNVPPPSPEPGTPPTIQPTQNANRVLEINSGLSNTHGFKPGDTVTFENVK